MFCEIHQKNFEQKEINVLGFVVKTTCPLCTEEEKEKANLAEKAEFEEKEKERIKLWAEIANIPKKYRTFNYKPHAQHSDIKDKMSYKFNKNLIAVGAVGCGKTAYISYLCMLAIKGNKRVRFTIANEINTKIRQAGDFKNVEQVTSLIDLYSSVDILVLDEIDELDTTKDIFQILNNRYNNNLITIFLGNINLKEDFRQIFGDKIADRIKENVQIVAFTNQSLR